MVPKEFTLRYVGVKWFIFLCSPVLSFIFHATNTYVAFNEDVMKH